MDQIRTFFIGSTPTRYVQAGFTEVQAEALTWIANEKPKGKFYGTLAGSFIAICWGHWHYKFFRYLGIKCSNIYTQLAILGSSIAFGDYITSAKRYGANEYLANNIYLNNNLLFANLTSLMKFTSEEVKTFNQRARALKSNIPISQRKWIFNPNIESQQEFERRSIGIDVGVGDVDLISMLLEIIKSMDMHKNEPIVYGPTELSKLIDQTGQKLGIVTAYNFGWRPLYPQQH